MWELHVLYDNNNGPAAVVVISHWPRQPDVITLRAETELDAHVSVKFKDRKTIQPMAAPSSVGLVKFWYPGEANVSLSRVTSEGKEKAPGQ